jgi:molybdopterin converting factor small subunit
MPEARTEPRIVIRLELFADLRRFLPAGQQGALVFSLRPGATVQELLDEADIPRNEEITVGLNGEQGRFESALNDGDEVVLFSPMEGG